MKDLQRVFIDLPGYELELDGETPLADPGLNALTTGRALGQKGGGHTR